MKTGSIVKSLLFKTINNNDFFRCLVSGDKFISVCKLSLIIQDKIEKASAEEVKKYVRYITDRRLLQLGLKTIFKLKENPLSWLEWVLNGADHTNFFENRVTEYEVAGLSGSWETAYNQ